MPTSNATPDDNPGVQERTRLAQAVRDACVEAALRAYEDAGMAGLCAEGRWEAAVSAVRSLDLAATVASSEIGPQAVPGVLGQLSK